MESAKTMGGGILIFNLLIAVAGCSSARSGHGGDLQDGSELPAAADTANLGFVGKDGTSPLEVSDAPGSDDLVDTPDDVVLTDTTDETDVFIQPDSLEIPDVAGDADAPSAPPECTDVVGCGDRRHCASGICVDECDSRAAALTGLGCLHLAVDLPNSTDTFLGGTVAPDEQPTALILQNPWSDASVEVIVRSVVGAGAIPDGTLTLAPNGNATVALPNRPLVGTTRVKAAFAVESDRPIIALMMSPKAPARSTSAVRLIPVAFSAIAFGVVTGPTRAFVTIAAAEDDTLVTIRPTGATLAGSGLKAMAAGGTYSLTLAASDVLHLEAPADVTLSGTRIDSSRPVAVFAGSATTTWGSRCCGDMVAEQMPPRTALGTVTIVTPGPPRGTARDVVHVVAVEDGTVVEIETPEPLKVTLSAGHWVSAPISAPTKVTASRPVLVAMQLAAAHARTAQGDVCLSTADCPVGQSCFGPPAVSPGQCIAECEPAQDSCPSPSHRCLDRFGALPQIPAPGVCARRSCDAATGACEGGTSCDPSFRCRESCTAASVCADPTEVCGLFGVALMCGAMACEPGSSTCPTGSACLVGGDGTAACTSGCEPAPKCETPGYRCLSDALYDAGTAPFTGAYCVAPRCPKTGGTSSACPEGFECVAETCVPRGDPALTVVAPVGRHTPRISLVVPDWDGERWLSVVAPVGASVHIDDALLSESGLTAGPSGWRVWRVPVTAGLHIVTSDHPVSAMILGLGPEVGWATSATTPLGLDYDPTVPGPEDTSVSDVTEPDANSPDATPLDTEVLPDPPTWSLDVGPLLALRCAPCHTGGSKLGGLSVDTYVATQLPSSACAGVNKGEAIARKSSGDPGCTGDPMPPTGPSLSPDEQAVLEAWVGAGQPE